MQCLETRSAIARPPWTIIRRIDKVWSAWGKVSDGHLPLWMF